MTAPLFSLIIPFKAPCAYIEESLPHIFRLMEQRFEVILLPDEPMEAEGLFAHPKVRIIPTGAVSPAVKRDRGAEAAGGEFLAFIDDDAYPDPAWLSAALAAFRGQENVIAVGGPAITPEHDPFWARASGAVFLSRLSGGFPRRYLRLGSTVEIDDWPTVNLLVRRDAFMRIGGFDSEYWPGEDTKLCMDLVRETGGRILYVPEAYVWHHRRPGLKKHLRQIGNYGLHRGHFARKHPATSRRPHYFIPAAWAAFFILGLLFFRDTALFRLGLGAYLAVLALALCDILRYESPAVTLAAAPYIVLTHLWYGFRFILGLSLPSLKSSLGR